MAETFENIGLNSKIIKAISELGYEKPTAVQSRIIPTILMEDKDIVCLAQTGTGKTAAFGLPVLHKIEEYHPEPEENPVTEGGKAKKWYSFAEKSVQALVLCPTRELCRQITDDLKSYARYMDDLTIVSVYGGAGIDMQIKMLRKNPQIIVATPGRMLDLLKRKAADISNIHTLILDEADEMLNMGFKEELDAILECAPSNKRVLLFSATLPIEVEKIAKTYMKKAEVVTVGERNSGADKVKHYYFTVHEKDRYAALKRIADYYPDIYGIIFCRTRKETQDIANALIKDGYDADALHGDLSQGQRDQVMGRFRNKSLKLLVATDVAARGIDVNNLTHVINYNLPDEIEQYTHRSGRTGRADKSGKSIVIINVKEQHKIKRIEKIIGKTFAKAKVPTGKEVCSKQLLSLIDRIDNIPADNNINEYFSLITERWSALSREDIIRKFLACEFNRFLEYYKNSPDLNIPERESQSSREIYETNRRGAKPDRRERSGEKRNRREEGKQKETKQASGEKEFQASEKGFSRVKINIGTKHDITTRKLIRIMTSIGVSKKGIGKIDIGRDACYISIAEKAAAYVVEQTNNTEYRGVKLKSCVLK